MDTHMIDADVVVAGGGTTGIAAALAAAREGATVLLVEQYGFLGGNATVIPAWLGFHSLAGEQMVKGIPAEAIERLRDVGGATGFHMDPICGSVVGVNTHWWKIVAAEMAREAGVHVLLHHRVSGVSAAEAGSRLKISCRDTVREASCRCLIDCTDTGEVARMAGAGFRRGRESDGQVQVASWAFSVGDVDMDDLIGYLEAHPEDARPFPEADLREWLTQLRSAEVFVLGAFASLVRAGRDAGMPLSRDNMPGIVFPARGEFFTVASRVIGVDPDDPDGFSQAELTGARQAGEWLAFLRQYVPGFSQATFTASPHQIGMRETNHLDGVVELTAGDLMSGKRFPDTVAVGAYHIDIHPPDHGGLETARPSRYEIPYRSLVPRGVPGVLVAGRAISATHEAMASTRVIPISMALGEAAGTAAAMCVEKKCQPVELDTDMLREHLERRGAKL